MSDIIQVIEPYAAYFTFALRPASHEDDARRMNAILVWRFMLNLQETRWRIEEDLTTIVGTQHSSTVLFDRVIGSMGDSLQLNMGAVEGEAGTREGELT